MSKIILTIQDGQGNVRMTITDQQAANVIFTNVKGQRLLSKILLDENQSFTVMGGLMKVHLYKGDLIERCYESREVAAPSFVKGAVASIKSMLSTN